MLLVLDDVWFPEQLAPFVQGGRRCARLVTTRVPSLLGAGTAVKVDQMEPAQARQLLTWQLPDPDTNAVEQLLAVTGRWPLLLHLANKYLTSVAGISSDVSVTAAKLYKRLRAGGPQAVDELPGEADRGLDVENPRERQRTVQATIQASTSLLTEPEHARFIELAVFAEDEPIPVELVARLWHATAGLERLDTDLLIAHLDKQLGLVSVANGAATMHDVVRDVLHHQLGA
jgi:hypothetical protein